MIAATVTALFMVVTIAALSGLLDSALRGHKAFVALKRERALVKASFVPVVEAEDLRLRRPARLAPAATRPFARRLPSRSPVPALGAA